MNKPIDHDMKANNTPQALAEYYLPFLISKKLDNTQIRTKLRMEHKFSEEKLRETMIILAELEFDFHRKVPSTSIYLLYFNLILAILMIIVGILTTALFWKMGYILFATPFVVLSGFSLLFKANKQIDLLRQ